MHTPEEPIEKFTDITIVKADVDNAAAVGDLWKVPLVLSDSPSPEWAERFEMEESAHWSSTRRKAILDGGAIVATCRLDELQTEVDDLKPIVEATNRAYRQVCADRQRQLHEQRKVEQTDKAERDKLRDVAKKLRL